MADKQLNIIVKAKDEASSQLNNIGNAIKSNYGKVAVAAGIAGAAITAFSGVALKGFADTGEQLFNFSKSTGIAADSASALKMAADEMGMSLEAVGAATKKMQVNLAGMAGDTKKADEALKPLGITFDELKALKPEDQFLKLGNSLASMSDISERNALAQQLMGKGMADLIPMFNDGTLSLDELKQKASEAGVMFDDLAMNKANALDGALDALNTTMAGVSQQVAGALAPAITNIITQLTPFIQSITTWMAANPELTAGIIAMTTAALGMVAILPGLVAALTALGAVFAFIAANPLILIIGALVAFAGWLIYLYNTNEEFRTKVNEVWGQISAFIATTIEFIKQTVTATIADLKAKWDDDWGGVRTKFEEVWNFLSTTGVEYVVTMIQKIKDVVTPIVAFFQEHWEQVTAIWNIAVGAMGLLWDNFWSAVKLTFNLAWDFLKGAIKIGLALMKGDWQGAWTAMIAMFITAWDHIQQFGQEAINNIQKFLAAGWTQIQQGFTDFASTVKGIWDGFWNGLTSTVESAKATIMGVINSITGAINSAISALQSLMSMGGGGGGGSSKAGGKKARGGSVSPGGIYTVGEEGMETFIPDQRGTIIPASKTSSGGDINIIITGNTVLSEDGAEQIGDMLFNRLKMGIKI